MIASFGDRATEDLFHGRRSSLRDLRSPPGNRLKALRGEMHGRHAIRVNDQWRLVFRWCEGDAHAVRLTDYH